MIMAVGEAPDYAFPHSAEDESRRLELLERRLDPLTKRRIQRLGVGEGARCLKIGGGRGSITRWLSDVAGLSPLDPGRLPELGPVPRPVAAPPGAPARPRGCRCRRRDRHH